MKKTFNLPLNSQTEVSIDDLNNIFSCLNLSPAEELILLDEITDSRERNRGKLLGHNLAEIIRTLKLKTKLQSIRDNCKLIIEHTTNDF